jgi:cell wall-associated NlpC family hydrolase
MRQIRRIASSLLFIALLLGVAERGQTAESLGNKIKKIFAPTPTPTPRKKRHTASARKKKNEEATTSPTPSPSPKPKTKETPEPSPTPKTKKRHPSPSPSPKASPTETPEPSASPKSKKHKKSPSPSPTETPSPTPVETLAPSPTPDETATASPSASSSPAKKKGAVATISPNEIKGFENYPSDVRKLISTALELTTRNLDYKYGSADPANGGMDCSGFVFYVLTQNGVSDVPRDSSQQYVWLRKAGTFRAVNSRHEDTFELDELVAGDLLFWTGTYSIERDPPITHAMIYLGREKGTNQRIMVGASDGRPYKGESRYGVSVFDFKIPRPGKTDEGRMSPSFIGYGHIPGVHDR